MVGQYAYRANDPIHDLFLKRIRKFNKPHTINREKIVGHSLAIGNPGFGKTSNNRRECELRWQAGHKIFCLYDAGRMDMAYFMFPSVSPFWRKPKAERNKIITSRRYPVTLLYPVTKEMPSKIPNFGLPFTIPVCDLDENDVVAMTGASSKDMVKGLFTYMESMVDEETTPEDYVNIMGVAMRKVKDSDGIKPSHHAVKKLKYDVFQPLISQGLLSSKTASTALNLEAEIKNRDSISVLVLRHCPQNLWGFLVHYFMNHLFKTLAGIGTTKRVRQKTTIVLNEVADLLSNDDESGGSAWSISKTIGRIAKQSRSSDMFMLLDTQIPQELPDVKDTMQRIYVFNSGRPEVEKAMEIIGISTRSGEITGDDIMIIPRLGRGWYYLFDRENGVSIHKQVWTRSRTYLSGEEFYEIYDKVYGKAAYTDMRSVLAHLQAEKEKSEAAWNLRRQIVSKESDNVVKEKPSKPIAPQPQAEPEMLPEPEPDTEEESILESLEEEPEPVAEEVIQQAEWKPKPKSHQPRDWSLMKRILPTLGK